MRILALDGHDAAGKTTLARRLADALDARYIRPFSGDRGRRLIRAYEAGDYHETIVIGHEAIQNQMDHAREGELLVMDRGWVTVATLVPRAVFEQKWTLWIPTVLLWCDEGTTRARLNTRITDDEEPADWHSHFLETYLDRFSLRAGTMIRTDQMSESEALARLIQIYENLLPVARST